jgi:hypothetical protein
MVIGSCRESTEGRVTRNSEKEEGTHIHKKHTHTNTLKNAKTNNTEDHTKKREPLTSSSDRLDHRSVIGAVLIGGLKKTTRVLPLHFHVTTVHFGDLIHGHVFAEFLGAGKEREREKT